MTALADQTPRQIDEQLAELDRAEMKAEQAIAVAVTRLHQVLGERARWVTRTRKEWPTSDEDAIEQVRAKAAAGERMDLMYGSRPFAEPLAKYDHAVQALAVIVEQAKPLDAEFGRRRWSRFFTVQSNNGHVHSSMSCQTCNRNGVRTSFGWNPHLSGLSEQEAIAELGRWATMLCTVCFPTAPIEATQGPQRRYCPGGRPEKTWRTGDRRYGNCPTCNESKLITSYGVVRRHAPKTTPPVAAVADEPATVTAEVATVTETPEPVPAVCTHSPACPIHPTCDGGCPPAPAAPADEVKPTAAETVWIAVARQGIDFHRLVAQPGRPVTGCGRSTRTGETRRRGDVEQILKARPCLRCYPVDADPPVREWLARPTDEAVDTVLRAATEAAQQANDDLNGDGVPVTVAAQVAAILDAYGREWPPTHPYCGADSDRAGRGDPGHCEACAVVGHVVAHPQWGCGDVQCNSRHTAGDDTRVFLIRTGHVARLCRPQPGDPAPTPVTMTAGEMYEEVLAVLAAVDGRTREAGRAYAEKHP